MKFGSAYRSSAQKAGTMFCPKCGAKNEDTAKFCIQCGHPLPRKVGVARGARKLFWLIGALVLAVVLVAAGVLSYPHLGDKPIMLESVAVVKHTFEAARGTDWDTGIGLRISIPPAPAEGKVKLVVKQSAPEQLEESFITLRSVYDISLASAPQEHSPVRLSFEIPEGVEPRSAVILQWTEEGWVPARGEEGIPGGTVSPDGRYISVVREQLSRYALAEWLYKHIFRYFENLPEAPPPSPIIKVKETKPYSYPGYLAVEVSLDSPAIWRGLGGTWYQINVRGKDHVKVEGSGWLAPGQKRNLQVIFPSTGGHATVCLNTKGALPTAAFSWASRLGVPASEVEKLVKIVERFQDEPAEWRDLVWVVKEALIELFWRVAGWKARFLTFLTNMVPVSVDIAIYISALTDSRPDPCVELSAEGEILLLWQKTYGGKDLDSAVSIQQTKDGGYIVAGDTRSFGAGEEDFYILKLDPTGKVLWEKT
ncbi:zinc ribbon domain-containing protein, partial [Candidatus Hakubella thermalkaliphila]